MRDFLVYTSAGHAANIKQWYRSAKKNYDIWVTNYTDTHDLNREYSDFYNEHKGSKFQNLKSVFMEHGDFLSRYRAIMVADDDVIIQPESITALFQIMQDNDIWILQPAFSRFGKISHAITRRRLRTRLRYVNFVEVTCPVFQTDKLLDFLSIYRTDLSTCFGIDWWYLHHLGRKVVDKYAISDEHWCINPLDHFKPGHRREIDLICTHEQRLSMWLRIRSETGIDSYSHEVYRQIPKSTTDILASIPVFAMEAGFNKSLALFSKLKNMLRPQLDG